MKKHEVLITIVIFLFNAIVVCFNAIVVCFIINLFCSCVAIEKIVCPDPKVKAYDSRNGETCKDEVCAKCVDLKDVP